MPKRSSHRRRPETIKFTSHDAADHDRIARRHAALLVVQGAELDLGTHVVCDRTVTLGRDESAELALRDGSISRRHCLIEVDAETGRYVLRDLGSTNGTRVNGSRVAGAVPLAEGDKIFLGTTVVKFGYADHFDFEFQSRVDTLVSRDDLTGMLSKRRFDAAHALALQTARGDGAPLSVLVMDMDGLKLINDTHGHEVGGWTITEVARILSGVLDGQGETSRFGGDEFMTFLPGRDRAAAAALAEKARDAVAQHVFERGPIRVTPTISIGVATFPEDGDTTDELFRAADRALYRAKAAGKNTVAS